MAQSANGRIRAPKKGEHIDSKSNSPRTFYSPSTRLSGGQRQPVRLSMLSIFSVFPASGTWFWIFKIDIKLLPNHSIEPLKLISKRRTFGNGVQMLEFRDFRASRRMKKSAICPEDAQYSPKSLRKVTSASIDKWISRGCCGISCTIVHCNKLHTFRWQWLEYSSSLV